MNLRTMRGGPVGAHGAGLGEQVQGDPAAPMPGLWKWGGGGRGGRGGIFSNLADKGRTRSPGWKSEFDKFNLEISQQPEQLKAGGWGGRGGWGGGSVWERDTGPLARQRAGHSGVCTDSSHAAFVLSAGRGEMAELPWPPVPPALTGGWSPSRDAGELGPPLPPPHGSCRWSWTRMDPCEPSIFQQHRWHEATVPATRPWAPGEQGMGVPALPGSPNPSRGSQPHGKALISVPV